MESPFEASNENIKRAERKFIELKSVVNRYLAESPYSTRIERDAHRSYVIARRDKDIPVDVPFDVVEIVGRLRNALDKAVVALVGLNGKGVSGVGFPFGGFDRNNGQADVYPSGRMTGPHGIEKKLTASQWSFIKAQKPHPGGNDVLWSINEVANADKHRADLVRLLVSARADRFSMPIAFNIVFDLLINPTNVDCVLTDQKRETVILASSPPEYDADVNGGVSLQIVFGDIMPVAGKNVLTTLNAQIRSAKYIVKRLERLVS